LIDKKNCKIFTTIL